ncbi:hypothetical protein [Jannaschia aquimarina]|uniref:Uncharacterized protein n=1 Tax=Jannaschia aquimarina TaxID=935700 RepID=A0A0D1EBG8_9RHOB|nr:hypothetical protein [Jannaschia aquimarina]KIT14246.1 hypothetical protein jaqu_40400 [Jannaschia aquimarina]SNS49135.1 hypothetical protein SAMN05421775_101160 [Jannaschia aquimarina]
MISVSFTKFLDFIAQSGEPKATTALQAWRQGNTPYDAKTDYHKRVREKLRNYERSGVAPDWEEFINAQNEKKQKNFRETIDCYLKWRSKQGTVSWIDPPTASIDTTEFRVSINPEMGLVIDGDRYAIKLFLRKAKLSKLKAQVAGLMMRNALAEYNPDMKFAVFDVKAGTFHTFPGSSDKLKYLLRGELAHMSAMLEAIRE